MCVCACDKMSTKKDDDDKTVQPSTPLVPQAPLRRNTNHSRRPLSAPHKPKWRDDDDDNYEVCPICDEPLCLLPPSKEAHDAMAARYGAALVYRRRQVPSPPNSKRCVDGTWIKNTQCFFCAQELDEADLKEGLGSHYSCLHN